MAEKGSATEISARRACPCGSGSRYGKCCKKKQFRWVEEPDGSLCKEIPIGPEMVELLREQAERFRAVFGREPAGSDPVFFERVLTTTRESFEEDYRRDMLRAMKSCGTDPAFVYAFQKTGLVLTDTSRHFVPDVDVLAWKQAVEEYRSGKAESLDESPDTLTVADLLEGLRAECTRCVTILSSLIRKLGRTPEFDAGIYSGADAAKEYIWFCVARATKTLQSLQPLIEGGWNEDALTVVRSLYESYLHIAYVRSNPGATKSFAVAKIGTTKGTHAFEKTKSGKDNTRIIVDLATGERIPNDITPHDMASQTGVPEDMPVFKFIYRILSHRAHPHIFSLPLYADSEGLTANRRDWCDEALIYALSFAMCIAEQLVCVYGLNHAGSRDARALIRAVRPWIAWYWAHSEQAYLDEHFPEPFRARVERLRKVEAEPKDVLWPVVPDVTETP